jgi:putative hemolysin
MSRKILFSLFMLIGIVFSASCSAKQTNPTPEAGIANPASVYCEQNDGKLELRQEAAGGVAGVCVFPDGSECDEWAYFRGECKPGDTLLNSVPTASPVAAEAFPTATAEIASDGWKIYRNEKLGYSFHYPANGNVITNDELSSGLSIIGPVVGSDDWPIFGFSHPSGREEYRPPEDVDLEKWLVDHNLSSASEVRQPDTQIAGTTAIHIRYARSPQTYAFDRYYFARSGQLYVVSILHAGDKEDWELYNRFLESIQFER